MDDQKTDATEQFAGESLMRKSIETSVKLAFERDQAAEPVKPIDPEVQATIERNDYLKMLNECIPTLKAEYHAAMFMRAFLMQAGDTHVHRAHFMRSAGRITGGLPPMVETALNIVRASKPAKSRK